MFKRQNSDKPRVSLVKRVISLPRVQQWISSTERILRPYTQRFKYGMNITNASAKDTWKEMGKFFSAAHAKASLESNLSSAKEVNEEVIMSRLRSIDTQRIKSIFKRKPFQFEKPEEDQTEKED